MKRTSVWVDTGPAQPERPQLGGDVEADVVVIGGGIVGITTALLLQEAGVDACCSRPTGSPAGSAASPPPRSPRSTG